MTNPSTKANFSAKRGSARVTVLVAVIGLIGLAAGVLFSNSIRSIIGLDKSMSGGTGTTEPDSDQLWTCGMHPQVIQDKPGDCPICHMDLTPLKVDQAADGRATHAQSESMNTSASTPPTTSASGGDRKVKYWWDPMLSPPYISDKPGISPMGMELIPVYEDEASPGSGGSSAVVIDPVVVQNMGVRVEMVTEAPLRRSIRVVGYLDEAQPNIRDINLRISGWIRRLHADTEGMHVQEGDPLFDLYSPELRVAIEELITARRSLSALESASDEMDRRTAQTLHDAAVQKLELWDLPRAQIEALAKLDRAPDMVTFVSPITGHVTEKPVVEGAAIMAGDRVLRIVDHSTLWIDGQVFEKDLPFVSLGQKVEATIASRPGERIDGEVTFIHPHVNMMTRTALVRLALPNPDLTLRPGMYATVRLEAELAPRAVMAPREAIIDTGERQMAFVAKAVGRFEPRMVTMGHAAHNGMVQVMEGLAPGEAVVVSGQFLLDSESRLREAIQKFLSEKMQMSATSSDPAAPSVAPPMAHQHEPTAQSTPAEVSPEQQQKADAVVSEYLKLSSALGAVQEKDTPPQLDPTALIAAAHSLHGVVLATKYEPLAVDVAKAAEAIKGQSIDHQRQVFSALGEKVIALADALPPTTAVAPGGSLYVMNCPMAPGGAKGDWLQASPDLANPFFPTEMKQCGSQVRTITTVRASATGIPSGDEQP